MGLVCKTVFSRQQLSAAVNPPPKNPTCLTPAIHILHSTGAAEDLPRRPAPAGPP